MGCTSSKSLSSDPAAFPADAFVIRIDRAMRVPSLDVGSPSDPYVRVSSSQRVFGRTPVKVNTANPEWMHVMDITGVRLDGEVSFDLWDRDIVSFNDRIGFVRISTRDLIKRPSAVLLVNRPGGSADFVTSNYLPTELHVTIVKTPVGWPQPIESEKNPTKFAKHCLIITRGTRGDVQPYCALARGLANQRNWMVTICTELRYKSVVLGMNNGLEQGTIRFRPSGGDTHTRIDKPIAKWAMKHESELMQLAMLARSEREFFMSEPAMYYWCDQLKPDYLVYGFTMVNIAMILSEVFHIPCCGFVLQPTSLPSKAYPPVATIDSHLISYIDGLEASVSNHGFLQKFKRWMEDDPIWRPLSAMRERRGLRPFTGAKSETFSQLYANNAPIVIPINEVAFGGRPQDWPKSIQMTDFIFLQGEGVVPKLSEVVVKFIESAKLANEPVVVMTFSSMPVSRRTIVQSALAITTECKSQPRVIALSGAKIRDSLGASAAISKQLEQAVQEGKVLELEGAPFGLLFSHVDAAVIHGGLGTTGDAMRAGIPTSVAGTLLMDQRFWGKQCEKLGVGGKMVHIAHWRKECVSVVDELLLNGERKLKAKELAERMQPKPPLDGGVTENVNAVVAALATAKPINTKADLDKTSATVTTEVDDILQFATPLQARNSVDRRFSLAPIGAQIDVPSDDSDEFLL
ncbi:hypothetical protein BASA81_005514 [Batrachochytrium salamandrivorans]|nr:hypothetical protein BASA81_005514 [Batrachochytrium salamandrivorans]